eukprot:scaffold523460_cov41-Prasinocladus_malaysianus.AAC.1
MQQLSSVLESKKTDHFALTVDNLRSSTMILMFHGQRVLRAMFLIKDEEETTDLTLITRHRK